MKKRFSVLILAFLGFFAPAATIYVDANGTGDYPTIQEAINAANNGDEIILLPGIFTGSGNRNIDYKGKAITVRSTDPNNLAVISTTVIDCQQSGRGFYFHNDEGPNSILAGVTIINGLVSITPNPPYIDPPYVDPGPGWLFSNSEQITQTVVTGLPDFGDSISTSGDPYWWMGYIDPGILPPEFPIPNPPPQLPAYPPYSYHTPPQGIPWFPNPGPSIPPTTYYPGPAILCQGAGPLIINCIAANNTCSAGGAIQCHDSEPMILGCIVDRNQGRGIALEDCNAVIAGCQITRNRTGITCYNGNVLIVGCKASHNGAGVILEDDTAVLFDCIVSYNYGTGIYAGCQETAVVTNCTVFRNSIPIPYAYSSSSFEGEGGISASRNTRVSNCILYENYHAQINTFLGHPEPSVTYCNIQGGWAGEGNIDEPPMLTRDCHLMAGSPCIDAGTDVNVADRDIDGEIRPAGSGVDIGADEFIDTDGDGLPDWWEFAYLHNETVAEPNGNPDGDIHKNSIEYEYSGNPVEAGKIYYVDYDNGSNNYDGLAPAWDGVHGPMRYIDTAFYAAPGLGDTIVIMPGVHPQTWDLPEGQSFMGKWLVVRSLDPNDPCVVASTILDCESPYSSGDDSRAFWFRHGEGPECVVSGLTIINGKALRLPDMGHFYPALTSWPFFSRDTAAAIFCDRSSPTIEKCVIKDCEGDAVFCYDCSATVKQCTLRENRLIALTIFDGNPTIEDCLITHNDYSYEGAVSNYKGKPHLVRCTIEGNPAPGLYNGAGSEAIITDCDIRYNSESGVVCAQDSNATMIGCRITANTASSRGAGIYQDQDCLLRLRNCIVEENICENMGSAIYTLGELVLENCIIRNNMAGYEAAVIFGHNQVDFRNCIIKSNRNGMSGYREGKPIFVNRSSNPWHINNSIIWGNNGRLFGDDYEDFVITCSDVQGGVQGQGNINVEPLLTPDGHLTAGSPCIDAGTDVNAPSHDVDNEMRFVGAAVDIGIDEFIDTDGDGLPDWWEQEYFGSATAAEPNDDSDGDGHTNIVEYELYSTSPIVAAKVYYVDANIPDDSNDGLSWATAKQSVRAALELAQDSDTIILAPGLYEGEEPDYKNTNLDPNGKLIIIRSVNPEDANIVDSTIIKAKRYRCFWLDSGESRGCTIDGLTLISGWAQSRNWPERKTYYENRGGAILCEMASPTIRRCRLTGEAQRYGPIAICCGGEGAAPLIEDCTMSNCLTGIDCHRAWAVIRNCVICDNRSSGILLAGGNPTISNCFITRNGCGPETLSDFPAGIKYNSDEYPSLPAGYSCAALIENCLITDNRVAGILSYSSPVIRNCIFAGNGYRQKKTTGNILQRYGTATVSNCILGYPVPPNGSNIQMASAAIASVSYCDVIGGTDTIVMDDRSGKNTLIWGAGNMNADPCFVVPGYWDPNGTPSDANDDFWVEGDYHLLSQSLCINAGDPNCVPGPDDFDFDGLPRVIGGRVDIGAYEYNHQPVADAGADMTAYAWIDGRAEVTLDGAGSIDEDNDPLDYFWSWIIDGNVCEANGMNPDIALGIGTHQIELLVDDGIELSEPDYCTVDVIGPARAKLYFMPHVLNGSGRGRILAMLCMPTGVRRCDIDRGAPLVFYPGQIEAQYTGVFQMHHRDHKPFDSIRLRSPQVAQGKQTYVMAWFDKSDCMDNLCTGFNDVEVAGQFVSGRYFSGGARLYVVGRKHRLWRFNRFKGW